MDPGTGNLWSFNGGLWWHFILRAAVVYFMVLLFIRFSGKRQVGQMTPFDLVLFLLISNAVQNAINGGDNFHWTRPSNPSAGDRWPITSTGAGVRINVLGFVIMSIDYAVPHTRPAWVDGSGTVHKQGGYWIVSLTPPF